MRNGMKFLNSKTAEISSDAFCSVLLGTAICALLFPVFRMNVVWGECLLYMLADIVLVVLFSRRWWILPSLLLLAAILSASISSILETNEAVLSYIGGFFQWCASGYTDIAPYSANGSMIIVHAAYVLPVAGLIFLYFRKLFFFYILPPAVLAMLLIAVLNKSEALWPILIMLLFVLFVSLAKMRGSEISSRKENGISSAMLSISAIIIMPVLLGTVLMIAPEKDNDWLCKPLVNTVQDFVDFLGFNQNQAPSDGSFSMGLTGFSPLENRLGGDITANNDIVLRVKTNTPVKLTGVVFDTYDGVRWYDSFSRQRHRFQSPFWNTQKSDAFGYRLPNGSPQIRELFDKVTLPAEYNITSGVTGRTLFYAGRITSISSEKPDASDIFFNNQSELFTIGAQRSFDYSFNTVVFDISAADFDQNMLALEKLTAQSADPALENIKTRYLPLPDTLPQSVYDMADKITSECKTPYEKALAIKSWLSGHCEYTLTPGSPPEGEDFVASFLRERKGYCVYFASAMTVMSRCAGLPARYVIGFGLKRSPFTKAADSYMATNAMAHAWTEIYFQGIGWVPFDATSWNFDENAVVETSQQSSNYIPPIPTPGIETQPGLNLNSIKNDHIPQALLICLLVIAGLLIAITIYILIRFLMLQQHGISSRMARKLKSNTDKMDMFYRRILHQAACLGIVQAPFDTITSFAQRVDEKLGDHKMTEGCAPLILMRFGREMPTDEDVQRLSAFSEELERRLRRELGLLEYLWTRIIKYRRLP